MEESEESVSSVGGRVGGGSSGNEGLSAIMGARGLPAVLVGASGAVVAGNEAMVAALSVENTSEITGKVLGR